MSLSRSDTRAVFAKEILRRLTAYKERVGSWAEVARELEVEIRTLHRWRKTKRINLVREKLADKCPEIFS